MPRILFKSTKQNHFLLEIKQISGLSVDKLAFLCSVSPRTFRDWLREKFSLPEEAALTLANRFSVSLPQRMRVVDNYWYVAKGARKGGLERLKLYGPPGTPEGRKKGGAMSQLRRKENPEKYKLLGCNIRKKFRVTCASVEFAEAAGIILGDGGITDNQVRITLSSLVDQPYAAFVANLFEKVFESRPILTKRPHCNAIDLTISGAGLIEELERWGFVRGDKVKHQVDFPDWIIRNIEFQKACVRGLMDTDGGCYFHKHRSNGLMYRNFGMCFSNKSLPLITSTAKVLTSLGIKFFLAKANTRIYIYSFTEIKKYFSLINSHNPKNLEKFNSYLNEKSHRVII